MTEPWNHAFDLMHFLKVHEGRYVMVREGAAFTFVFEDAAAAEAFHAILARAMDEAEGR